MKKYLIAGVLILAASAANAGSLTLSADPGGLTKSVTLSAAEVLRIVAWGKATYGQICTVAEPPVCRDRTNAEVFDAIAIGMFRGIRDNERSYSRGLVEKPAGDAVVPIGVP